MRVLRIGTSNDDAGPVPETGRAWKIAERILAEATDEEVQTVLKRAWPSAELPALVDRWIAEFAPEFVVLQVNNFWYGHESTPLWLDRRLGRAGRTLGQAGAKVGRQTWVADNRWAQLVNRRVLAVLPKATHFSVLQVAECMEAVIRKVIAHEGVILLVRGNEDWVAMPMAGRRFNRRNRARNAAMSAAMRGICERLHVPYAQRPPIQASEMQTVNGAGWHNNARAERETGEFDGRAMVAAWQGAGSVASKR